MKKTVLLGVILILSILIFSACVHNEFVIEGTMRTNAEKIIGQWDIVGESDETDSGEQLYEYYNSPEGSWIFNADGTYTVAFAGLTNYTYSIKNDTFIISIDEKSGEYIGCDLKISWHGEELILTEYWREGHYKDAPYVENDDHDFYILKRKK